VFEAEAIIEVATKITSAQFRWLMAIQSAPGLGVWRARCRARSASV
jgi:hypothetical protein